MSDMSFQGYCCYESFCAANGLGYTWCQVDEERYNRGIRDLTRNPDDFEIREDGTHWVRCFGSLNL